MLGSLKALESERPPPVPGSELELMPAPAPQDPGLESERPPPVPGSEPELMPAPAPRDPGLETAPFPELVLAPPEPGLEGVMEPELEWAPPEPGVEDETGLGPDAAKGLELEPDAETSHEKATGNGEIPLAPLAPARVCPQVHARPACRHRCGSPPPLPGC